ncbi:hypothetical protein CA983_06460 [Streptomyces swartbergensis]|uniref:Uncharacterized protein n=1 Tax=Streptomyces swartbergensis TaxID=487165 RepID=A0A243S8S2_9ACTN|nr:hypothetical protein CA983_06460 [Streptomyces swartbergensis]
MYWTPARRGLLPMSAARPRGLTRGGPLHRHPPPLPRRVRFAAFSRAAGSRPGPHSSPVHTQRERMSCARL